MRRTRRKLLRVLAVPVLLVGVLAGLVAAGWMPPFNRWVERYLLAELTALGVEADAAHLRELSWRRAVVGPVELQLPGLVLRAEEARAELGWRVLARRLAPQVVVSGLTLEVDLDRANELRGALQPSDGGFPYGRLELERVRIVLRRGGQRLELPLAGFFDSRVEEFRAVLALDAPELSGRIGVRGDLGEGTVELKFHEVRALPERWRPFLAGWLPAGAAAVRCANDDGVTINGVATLAEGHWREASVDATLPALEWREAAAHGRVGPSTLRLLLVPGGSWRGELRTPAAAWTDGARQAEITDLALQVTPDTAQLQLAEASGTLDGFRVTGGGAATLRHDGAGTITAAEATLRVSVAEGAGWALAEPAALRARWDGANLLATADSISLTGPCPVRLETVEALAAGWREGAPQVRLTGGVAGDAGRLLAAARPGWRLEPAVVAAKFQANASLVPGAEAVRVDCALPAQKRLVVFPFGRAEAVVGAEAVLNLDRAHLSGRLVLETRELSATAGTAALVAPELVATVRWPRVWHRMLTAAGRREPGGFGRDLWWSGDYEVRTRGASLLVGGDVTARGVDLQVASRGAELHEEGGLDVGLNAAEVTSARGWDLRNLRVEATAGLLGGRVRAGCDLAGLPVRPAIDQTLRWDGMFSAEGSFGFDPAVFDGREALARWAPALAGCELRGGLGLSGTSRYAEGKWTLGADVILNDLGVRWPKDDFAVEGLRGRIGLDDLLAPRTRGGQSLAIGRLGTSGLALTDGAVEFTFAAPGNLNVDAWSGAAFGGRVEGTGFACDVRDPAVETTVTLKGVRLEELLALFDDVPAEAQGAVDGVVPVRWRDGKPGFGTGVVRLGGGELGRVRFTKDLHLLTSGRTPGTAAYEALRKVELAIQVLMFNRLQIDTYPKDTAGQSLRIRLAGAPAGGEFEVPVSLDVNVNAPLEHFFNLGRVLRAAPPQR